jgi:hypothetical protein
MKFIEWFTNRGEHYDHNLRILDRHMKDLLVTQDGKQPKVHSYFIPGNRVQFSTSTYPRGSELFQETGSTSAASSYGQKHHDDDKT